jgi:hypothetical protein
MTGGGILQLVAQGTENLFLNFDPQITFFKVVYRRHTNFSSEPIAQSFIHNPEFGKKTTCILSKSGDLIDKIYIALVLPTIPQFLDEFGNPDPILKFAWIKKIGFGIIKSVEIEIGGQKIDKHYADWLNIWSELVGPQNYDIKLKNMIGDIDKLTKLTNGKDEYELFIPLQFWFCRASGLALPMVNLQYNDVKINLEINDFDKCHIISPTHYIEVSQDLAHFTPFEYIQQNVNGVIACGIYNYYDVLTKRLYYQRLSRNKFQAIIDTTITTQAALTSTLSSTINQKYLIIGQTSKFQIMPSVNTAEFVNPRPLLKNIDIKSCFLLVNYIYLDEEERARFSETKHEYLIEQLQYVSEKTIEGTNRNINLDLNQPVKLVCWVAQQAYLLDTNNNDVFNYTDSYIKDSNGKEIGSNLINQATILLNGHERISFRPATYYNWVQPYQHFTYGPSEGINVYSFGLFPELTQPSGSCNMSKIDNIQLKLSMNPVISLNNVAKIRLYALGYNIIRVINGVMGILFAN